MSFQMWFLKLLLILTFANALMALRGHRYTNTWVVQINGDFNGAKRIAEKYGFTYKMKVIYIIFKNSVTSLLYISSKCTSKTVTRS